MSGLIRRLSFVVLCILLIASVASGQKDEKRMKDAQRHSEDAAKVFNEIMAAPDKGIPQDLLDKSEAIAIFPKVVKAAFIVGGQGGQGVVSRRIPGGWSAPAFFNIAGGSFGAQIGGSETDYVMLIMNDKGLNGLLQDKFELGGEAEVAAGPVGRTASAATTPTLDAGILSYSRSKGAFAGIALKGGTISPDNKLNEAVYGKTARDVLSAREAGGQVPSIVQVVPQTLSKYSSK
jgi:SH3 domain-containing YSC84-like protein 1